MTQDLLQPKIVLAVAAHPDDIEYCAGGTIAKWIAQGAEVHYLVLTDGCKGFEGEEVVTKDKLVRTRCDEQQAAADLLGVKGLDMLNYEDGMLEVSHAVKKDITRAIRRVKPDTVVAFDPSMLYVADINLISINHTDHRAAGQATIDAVFPLARDRRSYPELLEEGLEPHIVPTLLLIHFDKMNYFEDITDTIDKKLAAYFKHKSQVRTEEESEELIRKIAKKVAKNLDDAKYAEGFLRIHIA